MIFTRHTYLANTGNLCQLVYTKGNPMNIFVTDPTMGVQDIPDWHIVKMPLETCQMLSIVASEKWGHGFGTLPKNDGTPYSQKGALEIIPPSGR